VYKNFKKAADDLYYLKYKIEFGERDDDIYIVAYPKSGTTLMQMLVYQLVTDGEMSFKHIYDVSPWTRNDVIRRIKPRDWKSPRIIKTHDQYKEFDKGTKGRFIFVYRDGMDVAVSLYHQEVNYKNTDLEAKEYIDSFLFKKSYNWFVFTKEWMQNRMKLPILYIRYDDLLNNFDTCLFRITKFLNIEVNNEVISRIKERCSLSYMKTHQEKFGEQPPEKKKIYDQFIRQGKSGEGKEVFSEGQKKQYALMYKKHLYFLN